MKSLSSTVFAVILFFYSQILFSEEPLTHSAIKLAELLSGLDSYSASFQQTVTEEDGYVLDENMGIMSFERPSKLFWEVQEPFPNILVSDGEQVYFYDPDLDQVTVRSWSPDPSVNPVAVFIGGAEITDYYKVVEQVTEPITEKATEADSTFVLTPLNSESNFSEIHLEFNQKLPSAMRIADNLGQITSIRFSPVKKDAIPEQPYIFNIPASAEVINNG